jgi:hypothetical protein
MKQSWLLRFRKSPPHTQTNIVCTALIMVATIAYAFIAGFQLSAMRGTLAEMKRSGEQSTAQMWSAINNINWMARSMDLSQKTSQQGIQAGERENGNTLKATIDNFHKDQRAWVTVVGVSIDPIEVGMPAYGHAIAFNAGKTVAKRVIGHWHMLFFPAPVDVLPPTEKPTEPESVGILVPTGRYDSKFNVNKKGATELDKTRITGDWYTYIWGEITYIDIFKNPHRTLFCSYRQGITGDFNQCSFHNDAD